MFNADQELAALLELERVDNARASLNAYCSFIPIPGVPVNDDEDCETFYPDQVVPAEHHQLINEAFEQVERGDAKRVMLFMPPGSAKTTYASVIAPTWFMGKKSGRNIIAVSYGSDLAKKFARRCRSIVRSKEYNEVFDCHPTGDNSAVDDWSLTNGSTYMAGGILSGITGNRADLLIADDPIKGREEADSETIREKVWEAYKSDLRTRLKPGGSIVVIMTRWHEDDLAGRILPENYEGESGWIEAKDGEEWLILNLAAQCERADDPLGRDVGEWLWTDWFTPEHWEQEKKSQGTRNWSALYQQRPSPDEGDFFQRDWFKWYDYDPSKKNNGAPEHLHTYGASDYAVTDDGGDYTVHGVCGIDPNQDIYILDWWREQKSSDVWIETLLDMQEHWKTFTWAEESGQISKSLAPFIVTRMRERRVHMHHKPFPSAADKPTRAQSIRGRAAQGKVYLPKGAPWVEALMHELLIFPNGKNDDQVDVLSLFGRILATMTPGQLPEKEAKPISLTVKKETWNSMMNRIGRNKED
jgi:predicted phage terminase large subunit-like protein